MAYNSVWGFGGVLIFATNDVSPYLLLDTGIGNLKYTPQYQSATNWKNKNISRFLGYKVTAEVDLLNIRSADHVQFQRLMIILSKLRNSDLTVFPRWVPDLVGQIPNRIGYSDFILTSKVELIEGNLLQKFQTLNLEFEKRALVDNIPTNISYSLFTANKAINGIIEDNVTIEDGTSVDIQVF